MGEASPEAIERYRLKQKLDRKRHSDDGTCYRCAHARVVVEPGYSMCRRHIDEARARQVACYARKDAKLECRYCRNKREGALTRCRSCRLRRSRYYR